MRRALLQALEDKYNADISNADATIQIYLWAKKCSFVILNPMSYTNDFFTNSA